MQKVKSTFNYLTSLGGHAPPAIERFLKYSISNSLFLLPLDLGLLFLFISILKTNYFLAVAAAFTFTSIFSYFLNRNMAYIGTKTKHSQSFPYFILFSILGLLITIFLGGYLVTALRINYILAKLASSTLDGVTSFILHAFITFKINLADSIPVS